MTAFDHDQKFLISSLYERQKELSCIHQLEKILTDFESPLVDIFNKILELIPEGWQYPEICFAEIVYNKKIFILDENKKGSFEQKSPLFKNGIAFGEIKVYYKNSPIFKSESAFLLEEYSLLNTISSMLSSYLAVRFYTESNNITEKKHHQDWKIILNMLQKTDLRLFLKITRKLLNHLIKTGVKEAHSISIFLDENAKRDEKELRSEINTPTKRSDFQDILITSKQIIQIAEEKLSDNELMDYIQKCIHEDKLSYLITALENKEISLSKTQDEIFRYLNQDIDKNSLSSYTLMNLKVMMIQKLFTSQLEYINVAKNYIEIEDFYNVLQKTVYPDNSHGRLGGKSTGLFFAYNILKSETDPEFQKNIKVPKTWYVTSDTMLSFLHYNNLEEVIEQKYKEVEQVRAEYGNIIQMFKNSHFPHDIRKGFLQILDDIGENPIIVRSSSLLEDSFGAAFSGKYKSLFLANQGSKQERLYALEDAITEVYASIVGPDPIEYRKERGLLDFNEEMAILIQEIVGRRVGKYFFPAFAGVAFSNNEFRWSPRIRREDGLVRLVPGLGTRAVDRLSNDYPILASPGQPGIRVNATVNEILKYSPKNIDLINLETNEFESMPINKLLEECKDNYPMFNQLFSVNDNSFLYEKSGFKVDFEKDDLIPTFNGLIKNSSFLKKMKKIIDILKNKMGTPVDIEFAVIDNDVYILQCRPQSFSNHDEPLPIPQDIPDNKIIFNAHKYISNGRIPEITHLVYVSPEKYNEIKNIDTFKKIGRCVGKLNKILPKKKFILMGPGRWGSKGDIKLGVPVTYSDINNTAVLIEIAKEKGNYVPDLSFGTHFFQDLVEAQIRYIPLYPDDKKNIFNNNFFRFSKNIISEILNEYSDIEEYIKVIDISSETKGSILKVFMNADLEEAIAYLGSPGNNNSSPVLTPDYSDNKDENFWFWRKQVSDFLAKNLNTEKFGVKDIYLFGSVKNGNSGPASDIDLLVHFDGNEQQKEQLLTWLNGWSICLDHFNYLKTGYKTGGLLDIHIITDEDIKNKTSYAVKINAITDRAQKLEINR